MWKKYIIINKNIYKGNGHERDFHKDPRVFILDVYNKGIYPKDTEAKKGIDKAVELHHLTEDNEYLVKVEVCVYIFIGIKN